MEDKKKRRWMLAGAFAVGFIVALALMTLFNVGIGDKAFVSYTEYENAKQVADKYAELESLYNFLEDNYYIDLDEEDMMTGIYKGLFASPGDIYTRYMTPEEYKEAMESIEGTFEGIGVTMAASESGYIQIVSVMEDSPAEEAGLREGDLILEVNGKSYMGVDLEEAATHIKGESGTSVKLLIQRKDQQKEYTITRAPINEASVTSKVLDDNIGYIRIRMFMTNTAELFEEAISELEEQKVKGLIIDLRSNGGGMVDQSVKIADRLMDEGVIVYMENGQGERTYLRSAKGRTELPYVLLVNNGSASASEILTAGVQGNHEGTVIGTKTYGKGITQQMMKLKNGDGVEITISQYFSPTGKVIHEKGITPDIVVELEESDVEDGIIVHDRQLEKAEEYINTH
ncbi:MAG: S41 family peptidase [Firmicutes bacterium]|jgi:carboxyl-terminal processing protease|nr:S41 family peptidase [Bacillota bacterium]